MPKDGYSRGKRTCSCGDCKRRCASDGSLHCCSSKVIDRALAVYAEGASAAADIAMSGEAARILAAAIRAGEKQGWLERGQVGAA